MDLLHLCFTPAGEAGGLPAPDHFGEVGVAGGGRHLFLIQGQGPHDLQRPPRIRILPGLPLPPGLQRALQTCKGVKKKGGLQGQAGFPLVSDHMLGSSRAFNEQSRGGALATSYSFNALQLADISGHHSPGC